MGKFWMYKLCLLFVLQIYEGCSCIPENNFGFDANGGKCETACNHMPMFLGLFLFAVVFTFMTSTAITTAVLRYVVYSILS